MPLTLNLVFSVTAEDHHDLAVKLRIDLTESFRSKYKGIERYVVANTMWAPNKSVKFEKLVNELKCSFAIKKAVQQMVDWKKVVRYVVGSVKILTMEKGDFVTFDPKLRALLAGSV